MTAERTRELERWAREGDAVLRWLVVHSFSGFDPFDALESRLFHSLGLHRSAVARLAWIQFLKRVPINLRRLVGVPELRNPKTAGLVLSALARRATARGRLEVEVGDDLVRWLRTARPPGSAGWGYPFAWQNRAFFAPRGTPNAVCTVFVIAGLLDYAQAGGSASALDLALSASPFFLEELRRSEAPSGFCFSYTPLDATRIHNVNLLVAASVVRLAALEGDVKLHALALPALEYSLAVQRDNGAWPYGDGPGQGWVDGFHTGYNLVALGMLGTTLNHHAAKAARARGYKYFRACLVEGDGTPRYYDRSRYPIDIHAAAQAIITLIDCADLDPSAVPLARKVAQWTRSRLSRGNGEYVYQRGRVILNPIVYARWGQAWMLRALAELEACSERSRSGLLGGEDEEVPADP